MCFSLFSSNELEDAVHQITIVKLNSKSKSENFFCKFPINAVILSAICTVESNRIEMYSNVYYLTMQTFMPLNSNEKNP